MGDKQDKKNNEEAKEEEQALTEESQELEELQKEFDDLQTRFANLENQLKRAVADYQNLEKRVAEGRSELAAWATGDLIVRILPSLDHFGKAVENASEDDKNSGWFKGVEMALKQLQGVLKDEGLDQIRADGQFDPALHEAVDTRELTSAEISAGKNEGDILEVSEKGYTLNGKVLRPAKVVVGRRSGKETDK